MAISTLGVSITPSQSIALANLAAMINGLDLGQRYLLFKQIDKWQEHADKLFQSSTNAQIFEHLMAVTWHESFEYNYYSDPNKLYNPAMQEETGYQAPTNPNTYASSTSLRANQ